MSTYMTFLKYSAEGIAGISPERTRKLDVICKEMGGKLVGGYGLLGEWDAVVVYEVPDGPVAMKTALHIGKLTHAETQTMLAVPLEQFDKLL